MWSFFQAKSKVSAGKIPALQLLVVYIVSPVFSAIFMQIWPCDTGHERVTEIEPTL